MRYARNHPFTACADDEVKYQADEIKKLVGLGLFQRRLSVTTHLILAN